VKQIALLFVAAGLCFGGEHAVLQNGFRIQADRHEIVGDSVRLHSAQGTMELPASQILRFEIEEYVAPKPAPAESDRTKPTASSQAAPCIAGETAGAVTSSAYRTKPTSPTEPAGDCYRTKPAATNPQEILVDAATRHGILPEFIRSVAAVESAYNTKAISPKGAIGLMQLMPGTASELGVNPHDPEQNAEGGVRYLKELLLRYKNHKDPVRMALAAYNAGPGAVDRYRDIPPYRETQAYVEKVLRRYLAELKRKS
jgi:soluble lytic murein transglycosylase-like protein